MLAKSLIAGIIKRGGTATLSVRRNGGFEVVGELNGYDVHAYTQAGYDDERQQCGHYTVRRIESRGHYDPFSDYNPGGYTFLDHIKSLDWACPAPKVGASAA